MGNIEAVEKALDDEDLTPGLRDFYKGLFRAYHDEPVPTPESPKFKPDQWVIHYREGLGQITADCNFGNWDVIFHSRHCCIHQDHLRPATEAEIREEGEPEFKPDDWVVHELYSGILQIDYLVKHGDIRYWSIKSDSHIGCLKEKGFRLATGAEMYRPGAIATWQAVIYPDLSVTGKVSRIQMDTIVFEGMKLNYSMSKCTLITAAPEGEADDA